MARAKYLTTSQVRSRLRQLERHEHDNISAPQVCPYCKCKTNEHKLVKGIGWTWKCAGGCNP